MTNLTLNVYGTTVAAPSFLQTTQGYIEGFASDDPASRPWLNTGLLASTETMPMVGGVPITERVNVHGASGELLGNTIARATATSAPTGFSVFNQQSHMVIGPGGNQAPMISGTGTVGYYRFGTNARVAVQAAQALVTALGNGSASITGTQLYWDPVNFNVTNVATSNIALPSSLGILGLSANSKIIQWVNGAPTWTVGAAILINLQAASTFPAAAG